LVLLALLLVLLSNSFFTKIADERRHYRELRSNAYKDLIQGFSLLNIGIQTKDETKQIEAIRIITDAKFRIALFGSKRVLADMSAYWQFYEKEDIANAKAALVKAISSMRRDNSFVSTCGLHPQVIEDLLFSPIKDV
jgi:hypothetical protein